MPQSDPFLHTPVARERLAAVESSAAAGAFVHSPSMGTMPTRFQPALSAVETLAAGDRYLGALVFGSVAEGTATDASDLDVRVVVADYNACKNISHPRVGGVKLDITFSSLRQLEEDLDEETKAGERRPMIAGGVIVFDKTGGLTELLARANAVQPPAYDPGSAQFDRFMLYHANDKVERSLTTDPESSLYSMHATIGSVLEIHYGASGRFTVSSKKLLADLDQWDADFGALLRRFVATSEVQPKFELWRLILDHVARSFGGRRPIEENVCGCALWVADLTALASAVQES
jgi:predicted nucleotidyltransferase